MSRSHKCLVCGKVITWRFAICADCEKVHGSKPEGWPEWLQFLWRDEQRLRRRQKKIIRYETSFSFLPYGALNGEFNEEDECG